LKSLNKDDVPLFNKCPLLVHGLEFFWIEALAVGTVKALKKKSIGTQININEFEML
jgi:hypothetical protein